MKKALILTGKMVQDHEFIYPYYRLQEAGFEVLAQRYFFVVPTMLGGLPSWIKQMYCRANRLVWQLNDVLESCWPINRLSSNFMIVARKPNFAITDSRPDSETL